MIFPPHNKDCAIFSEQIGGRYYALHRPSSPTIGGNYIWLAESPDLVHWGNHRCLAHSRPGMWDSARVGAGAAPIRTPEGWLEIYHGADANNRYCLGALLLDLESPWKVLARSSEPIMEPLAEYERTGFFGNVVFTNGHVVDGDTADTLLRRLRQRDLRRSILDPRDSANSPRHPPHEQALATNTGTSSPIRTTCGSCSSRT